MRHTPFLTGVTVAAVVLLPVGVALTALGFTHDQSGLTVCGILAVVLGLACLRALFWVRRVRLLTRVGLSLHTEAPDDGPGGDG